MSFGSVCGAVFVFLATFHSIRRQMLEKKDKPMSSHVQGGGSGGGGKSDVLNINMNAFNLK